MKDQNRKPRKKAVRSPGYPMISLEEAVNKINILWEKEKSNPIPKEAALKYLGYTTTKGYSARILSAMKQFGLISEENDDIKLTQDAIDLAIYNPSSEDYKRLLIKIALYPISYIKIYNEYNGNIPSDETLKIKLIRDYNFNANKVQKFISTFKETINFAKLSAGNEELKDAKKDIKENLQKEIQKMDSQQTNIKKSYFPIPGGELEKSFVLRLKNENQVIISFHKFPVEDTDLQRIKDYIDLQKDVWTEAPITLAPITEMPKISEDE